ncbi:hypothetical protein CLV67_1671, partial [Actinoplanes italicus]
RFFPTLSMMLDILPETPGPLILDVRQNGAGPGWVSVRVVDHNDGRCMRQFVQSGLVHDATGKQADDWNLGISLLELLQSFGE